MVRFLLGSCLRRSPRTSAAQSEAIEAYRAGIALDDSHSRRRFDARFQLGKLLDESGDLDGAREVFLTLLRAPSLTRRTESEKPLLAASEYLVATATAAIEDRSCSDRGRKLELAIQRGRLAVILTPRSVDAHTALGRALHETNLSANFPEALGSYQATIDILQSDPEHRAYAGGHEVR